MGDAIVRTLWRLLVTRRHLLEWVTGRPGDDRSTARSCRLLSRAWPARWSSAPRRSSSPGCRGRGAWPLAAPFAALWFASPAVARWASLSPRVAGRLPRPDADARALRLTARRTWRFFETFVTPADHMLPPDNFQEDPEPVARASDLADQSSASICSRWSSARDFGWIGTHRGGRAAGGDACDHGGMAALSRPFLQLVRHARSAAARPAICFLGRQRQPGRASDRARQRVPRMARASRSPAQRVLPASPTRSTLTREEASRLRDGRRTQTVTLRQLDDALAAAGVEHPAG